MKYFMLRKIRLTLAVFTAFLITALFLDFTGTLHVWFGWLAKVQFLPAVLALNVGVVAALVVLTLVFGRIYCSVVCPLGVLQDFVSWVCGRYKGRKRSFNYSPAKSVLRCSVLAAFVLAMVLGIGSFVALLAPYSSYGRIVQNILSPLYIWGNNLLAMLAARVDSYAFYEREVWLRSVPTLLVAVATLAVLVVLAWRNGRTYCNTVCPVGTVLGFLSRFSWLKVGIDGGKCSRCGLCARACKASCIDFKNHKIDHSRCVVCGDCIGKCRKNAIKYGRTAIGKAAADTKKEQIASRNGTVGSSKRTVDSTKRTVDSQNVTVSGSAGHGFGAQNGVDASRRSFLLGTALATTAAALAQGKKKVDGGLAVIEDKKQPERTIPITPPGSLSAENMARHCTACQLCVSVCPNDVLRPQTSILKFMQPVMSYERGYCRPECTRCGEVCPTGAIKPITKADKAAIQTGHAVWIRQNCLPVADGVECGNCARHCPVGAITMVPSDPKDAQTPKIPVVNTARCIGCGACEHLCPVRPFSAMYVEGHERHRIV